MLIVGSTLAATGFIFVGLFLLSRHEIVASVTFFVLQLIINLGMLARDLWKYSHARKVAPP